MKKKLIIVGNSSFADIAFEYFQEGNEYEVIAFSVEEKFLKSGEHLGRPNIPFERIESYYKPCDHSIFVATVYTELNRLRTRLANESKLKGYSLASYISPCAFVWKNVSIGEHCFIFEDNTIQPYVKICDNVVLWSGNHIGHHSIVEQNCFISSHVVISGHCVIGQNSFLGVNSTVSNNVIIGPDNWIAPSNTITKNTEDGLLFKADSSIPSKVSSLRFFKIKQ
jgi:sugar O-acyltransferase (sialic acid O-acetyltransferase NeuD family)